MTVLVTGGSGFIGSHLVEELIKNGYDVRIADVDSPDRNLRGYEGRYEFVKCDVRNPRQLDEAVKGTEKVFHLAAQVGRLISTERPYECLEIDLKGTMRLIDTCQKYGVERIVFTSTSEVLGEAVYTPMDERHPMKPLAPYGVVKLAAERYCLMHHHLYGTDIVVQRLFNVYGPREFPSKYRGVVSIFINKVLNDQSPVVHRGCLRSFGYVKDVVCGSRLLMERGRSGEVYNIGGPVNPVTVGELAEKVIRLCGEEGKLKPTFVDPTPLDVLKKVPSIDKARKELGYAPEVTLEEGLKRTIRWQKENVIRK